MKPIQVNETPEITPNPNSSIVLDYTNYPLVVGNKSKTDFSDWETRGSSFTLSASVNSNTYSVSDLEWSVENEDIAYINSNNKNNISVKGKRTGFTKAIAKLPDGDCAICYISVIDKLILPEAVKTMQMAG